MAGRGAEAGRRNTVSSKRSLRSTDLEASSDSSSKPSTGTRSWVHPPPWMRTLVGAMYQRPSYGHPERFALTGHGDCREHENKSRISQPVVHPAGAERRVLHLSDERLLRTGHRLVPIGERDLKQHAPGVDEVDLHTDATLGVVEAVRADDLSRDVCWRPPWLGRSPFGDECFLGW